MLEAEPKPSVCSLKRVESTGNKYMKKNPGPAPQKELLGTSLLCSFSRFPPMNIISKRHIYLYTFILPVFYFFLHFTIYSPGIFPCNRSCNDRPYNCLVTPGPSAFWQQQSAYAARCPQAHRRWFYKTKSWAPNLISRPQGPPALKPIPAHSHIPVFYRQG